MKDWLLLMCAHMLLRVRLLLVCNGWPASMRTNKCENLAWEWDEKNPPPLLSSIRFKSSMFTHAKVLWSWGVTCENCPSRVYIYPSCWSLSSFQIGLSWQEEEFKMFSLAAISIKAWLSSSTLYCLKITKNVSFLTTYQSDDFWHFDYSTQM